MARVMPANKEAEMSIIGVIFLDNSLMDTINDQVNSDMFFDERNKYLYDAIIELYENHLPINAGMVKEELDKKKRLNSIGGMSY